MQDLWIHVVDKCFETALCVLFGVLGAVVKRVLKDLSYYFDMVRAATAISQDQENRLRRLEGKPELSDEQWRCVVKTYMERKRT